MTLRFDAELRVFLETLTGELAALERDVGLPLDRSYSSLDAVEDHLLGALPGQDKTARDRLVSRVERYVGATLVANAGGTWAMHHGPRRRIEPCVTKLPELRRYEFEPAYAVNVAARTRRPGALREETEIYDVPHRRRQGDKLLATSADELAAFADDVRGLTGRAITLDLGLGTLDDVQEALTRLAVTSPTRDRRRQLWNRAALYMGAVLVHAAKRGRWALCIDPKRMEFGHLLLDDWCPMQSVRVIGPDSRPDLLRDAATRWLEVVR